MFLRRKLTYKKLFGVYLVIGNTGKENPLVRLKSKKETLVKINNTIEIFDKKIQKKKKK